MEVDRILERELVPEREDSRRGDLDHAVVELVLEHRDVDAEGQPVRESARPVVEVDELERVAAHVGQVGTDRRVEAEQEGAARREDVAGVGVEVGRDARHAVDRVGLEEGRRDQREAGE